MRRINKGTEGVDFCIAEMLQRYRSPEYKEQILFAIETQTHFEIITNYQRNYYEIIMMEQDLI